MGWPPSDLEIARIQDDIRALSPSERKDAYARLSAYYGVSESTVRRHIPVGGRKVRVDRGASAAVIPLDVEEKIRQGVSVSRLLRHGEIEEGAVSHDQARRIRDGHTSVKAHAPPRAPRGPLSFKAWCEKHIFLKGAPWSLVRHEYLGEIYAALATAPYFVCRKAVQMGISTAVILNMLWRCDEYGYKGIYYLPTDEEAEDFSDDRVGADIIAESEYLSDLVGDRGPRGSRGRDNAGLRHIRRGSFYVRGMWTKKRVKSIDGDLVATDELDECNQENRKFAHGRVSHSPLQHIREISQPSIPGYGIDTIFAASDQRHWHLICPSCGRRTCLDHDLSDPDPVPMPTKTFLPVPDGAAWARPGQKYYRACAHCQAPLDMSKGKWVPQNPGARIRGYHVSALYKQICSPLHTDPADEIVESLTEAHTMSDRKHVTISILGLPFGGGKLEITDETLSDVEGDHGLGGPGAYMGIDQGDTLHITILDRGGCVVGLYIADDWADVIPIFSRHGVRVVVGDAMPEKSQMKGAVRQIDVLGGRGYICYYGGKSGTVIGDEDDVKKITTDRTESLDETVRMLTEGEIPLPCSRVLSLEDMRVYAAFRYQVKNLKRRLREDEKGMSRWEYITNVPNHFGMALNYARLAASVGGAQIDDFSVETRSYRDVRMGYSGHRERADVTVAEARDMVAYWY